MICLQSTQILIAKVVGNAHTAYNKQMSALDTAKEIIRIANTSTLSKDVIDLMERKLALLTDEVSTLNRKLSDANTRIAGLETENTKLKALAQPRKSADELPKATADVLRFLFDLGDDFSIEDIARQFQFKMSVAEYHFDILAGRKFVIQTRVGMQTYGGSSPAMFGLTSTGRAYVMQHSSEGDQSV